MMGDREKIFERIRQANNGRDKKPHPQNMPPPAIASLDGEAKLNQFKMAAEKQFVVIHEVQKLTKIPKFIAAWLTKRSLPLECVIAPILSDLDWQAHNQIKEGAASSADQVSVSLAFGAAAETGTVMMISGDKTPTSLNFLPDIEFIILNKNDIFSGLEGCWQKLRAWRQINPMPRAVNLITGPSRTADIEASMVLGVHGPRQLHIILIDEGELW